MRQDSYTVVDLLHLPLDGSTEGASKPWPDDTFLVRICGIICVLIRATYLLSEEDTLSVGSFDIHRVEIFMAALDAGEDRLLPVQMQSALTRHLWPVLPFKRANCVDFLV